MKLIFESPNYSLHESYEFNCSTVSIFINKIIRLSLCCYFFKLELHVFFLFVELWKTYDKRHVAQRIKASRSSLCNFCGFRFTRIFPIPKLWTNVRRRIQATLKESRKCVRNTYDTYVIVRKQYRHLLMPLMHVLE